MIRGAIFDLDGTLLDSMPLWLQAAERYLRAEGLEPAAHLGGAMLSMSMEEGADFICRRYLPFRTREEVVSGINGILSSAYEEQVPLKDGAMEFLLELKRRGISLALATATDRALFGPALRRLSLDGLFDSVLSCSECRTSKSEPCIYFIAAAALGTPFAETLVFEDALVPVRTASLAGFPVVAVRDEASSADESEIRRLCIQYIESYGGFDWGCLDSPKIHKEEL